MKSIDELIQQLSEQLGPAAVLSSASDDLAPWESDWRQRERGRALCVVRPANTEQVATVIKLCAAAKSAGLSVSVVPQGGNTGLVLGSIPDSSGTQIVLSLGRMNRTRALDADNLTITVEAGSVLQSVQEQAEQAGFLFPLSLAAEGSCQIGGNLGTNAGGTQVLRYGNARDICLGLEVVFADGEIWNGLSGLRKDNTGYDLRNLLVGSEGTLGVITAATLKLFPLPRARVNAWVCVPDLSAAVKLLGQMQSRLASTLTGFEVMGQFALSLVAKHFPEQRIPSGWASSPFSVLLDVSDHESEGHGRQLLEEVLGEALESGVAVDAVIAETLAQGDALWHIRETIPLAQVAEGLNIKHDISVPISKIADFCRETDALLSKTIVGIRLVNFGHLGDGNLHYNIQAPEGVEPKKFMAESEALVNQLVYAQVSRFGGSFSAEHGIGGLKIDELRHYKSPTALNKMRAIKAALDPLNLLNPGRLVPMP